jgi:MFS transporter, PPP family, 3-phenylpropionic acid transporter
VTDPHPPARSLLPYAGLSATYFAHVGFFNPYLTLWLKDLGLSLLAISMFAALPAATRLFAPYAWGALSDRTGERVKLLRWAASIAFVASWGLWFNGGSVWLGVVLLVLFTNTSAMMPMSEAALAYAVSHGGGFDTKRYGRVRLCGSLGFLVAVFAGGAWFEVFGLRHFPLWAMVTIGLVCICVWWMPHHREAPHSMDDAVQHTGLVWPIVRQPHVLWFFIALFFHLLAHIAVYAFFSLYCDALGYSKTTIGLLWAMSVITEIAWFYTQSRWLPRFSLGVWLIVCSVAMVLRMGLTAGLASSLTVLLIAQGLHALTFATHHTVCVAMLSDYFPGRLRGRGQALYTVIGYGLPGVLGGLAGGVVSTHWGLSSVFWLAVVASLCAVASAGWAWRLAQRQKVILAVKA